MRPWILRRRGRERLHALPRKHVDAVPYGRHLRAAVLALPRWERVSARLPVLHCLLHGLRRGCAGLAMRRVPSWLLRGCHDRLNELLKLHDRHLWAAVWRASLQLLL